MSRTYRKEEYRESRRFDKTCRNQGSCPYCAEGRKHKARRQCPECEDFDMSEWKAEQRLSAHELVDRSH